MGEVHKQMASLHDLQVLGILLNVPAQLIIALVSVMSRNRWLLLNLGFNCFILAFLFSLLFLDEFKNILQSSNSACRQNLIGVQNVTPISISSLICNCSQSRSMPSTL